MRTQTRIWPLVSELAPAYRRRGGLLRPTQASQRKRRPRAHPRGRPASCTRLARRPRDSGPPRWPSAHPSRAPRPGRGPGTQRVAGRRRRAAGGAFVSARMPGPAPACPRTGATAPDTGLPSRTPAAYLTGLWRRTTSAERDRRTAGDAAAVSLAPSRPRRRYLNRGHPRAATPHGLTAWLRRPGQ